MKTACITGATSGFGLACANIFAENGYQLILAGRRVERLEAIADSLRTTCRVPVHVMAMDVQDRKEVFARFNELPEAFRTIDVLINNAGLAAGRDPIQSGDVDDWEQMIDTNVKGLLYVTKAAVPGMVERKSGHIINISSLAGLEVYPQGNVYCATKHAVTALSKAMRQDLIEHGIKVTNVSPGLAETEFSLVRFKGDASKADAVYAGMKPLSGRDIAEVVWFAANRPANVNLEEITILPTAQADSRIVHRQP